MSKPTKEVIVNSPYIVADRPPPAPPEARERTANPILRELEEKVFGDLDKLLGEKK